MCFLIISVFTGIVSGKSIDLLDAGSMGPVTPNYCNDSYLMDEAGLIKASLGQFLGYSCSSEFYHCRWQSDGFLTFKKHCKTGLVYDVLGTQNCNYDYNVKSCGFSGEGPTSCNSTSFHCSLSEQCLPLSQRCDGRYDCALEEDEQNCPLCAADEFACIVSEQCIEGNRRCNGIVECSDGTDEMNCEVCGNGLFYCAKSGECVLMEERCDGKRQCPHSEDELLCKKSSSQYRTYTCESMKQKIPMVQVFNSIFPVCDGIPHCDDGSDEMYCETGPGGSRHTADSSIVFSSNPNPTEQEESTDYAADYEEETPDKEDEPSFPMLTVVLSSPSPVSATFPSITETPSRVLPPSKIRPSGPPTFSKRTKTTTRSPTLLTTKLATTTTTTTTTTTARPTTRPTRPSTEVTSSTSVATKKGAVSVNRYPTKPSSQVKERNLSVVDKSVSPRNEVPKQLFAQPDDSELKADNFASLPAVIHEVKITSASTKPTTPDTDPRSRLLSQLGTHLNGRVSPELLSKLERLLTEEVQTSPRKETTSGTVVESSPLVSHIAPVSSTSLVRAFTSRVQKGEKM